MSKTNRRFANRRGGKRLTINEKKEVKQIAAKVADRRVMDNYYHQAFAQPAIAGAPNGNPFQLTSQALGDAIGQRGGIGLMLKRLQVKIKLGNPATAAPADYIGRAVRFVMLRVYKTDPAFQPNWQLFMGNGTGGLVTNDFPLLQEVVGKKDITILYDKTFTFNDQANGDQIHVNIDKKYRRPTPVYYNGSNRGSGQFWACVIHDGPLGNPPGLFCDWKITYEDA